MAQDGMVWRTFVELADTLVEGYDRTELLHHLAQRCVSLFDLAEGGVVLADPGGDLRTVASSSERMRLLELIELQRQDGPCLDCFRSGRPVIEDDLGAGADRWPAFSAAAMGAGVRSVYALPLRLRAEIIGSLSLFADRPAALIGDDMAQAQAMADVATIGILHERVLRQREILAQQLQVALDSRVALEQAKGLVAEQGAVDMDEAFQLLRGHARRHNRFVSDVVAAVVRRELSATDLRAGEPRRRTSAG